MPVKRKTYTTRSRAYVSRKRSRVPRLRRRLVRKTGMPKMIHSFTRWAGTLTNTNTGPQVGYTNQVITVTGNAVVTEGGFACNFILNDLPDYSEFSALYDQFMIRGVLVTLKLMQNPEPGTLANGTTLAPTNFYPTVWYAPDHDDINVLTIAQLKEYVRVKHRVLRPNQEIKIMLRPSVLVQTYRTAVTTGYQSKFSRTWLDMATPDVPHYGFKMAIDFEGFQPPANTVWQVRMNAKYYLGMRNTR